MKSMKDKTIWIWSLQFSVVFEDIMDVYIITNWFLWFASFTPEVPKTEKAFEERLILKAFLLKFVNSYAPIFYVAFFKGR